MLFLDRTDAGLRLAALLKSLPELKDAERGTLLVLSIPRGGVVIGKAVADALGCAHDVIIVKKIASPVSEELAVGAVAEDGAPALNRRSCVLYGISRKLTDLQVALAQAKVARYIALFRQGAPLHVQEKTILMVDDGIATGETVKAAVRWLKTAGAAHVIVATPVCSPSAMRMLRRQADAVYALAVPADFAAVGQFYLRFEQVDDDEVIRLLKTIKSTRVM